LIVNLIIRFIKIIETTQKKAKEASVTKFFYYYVRFHASFSWTGILFSPPFSFFIFYSDMKNKFIITNTTIATGEIKREAASPHWSPKYLSMSHAKLDNQDSKIACN